VVLASSRIFQKSRPQVPNSYSPSSSSTPVTMSNGTIPSVASEAMPGAGSSVSYPPGPRYSPKQPQSWKGKAVVPITLNDENSRPTKRQRTGVSIPASVRSRTPGSRYPPDDYEGPSIHPANAEDVVSPPISARNVNATPPPVMPLDAPSYRLRKYIPRNLVSNAKAFAVQRSNNPESFQWVSQQRSDKLPPHLSTNSISQMASIELSNIPPWRSRATKQKLDPSLDDPGEKLTDPAPTTRFNTELPSSRTFIANPALPPAADVPPSYQPPCMEAAAVSQRPSSAENIVSTMTVNLPNPPVTLPHIQPHKTLQYLPRNTISNSNALADQRSGNLESSSQKTQQPSDQSSPHISTNPISRTVNKELPIIPPWRARATKRERELSTKIPSTPTIVVNSVLPLPARATPSYQPLREPIADAEVSKRPQSFSNIVLIDTNGPAPFVSTTDVSSSHGSNTTSASSCPGPALNTVMSTYDVSQRPRQKSIESSSTISSADVLRTSSAPAPHVKEESPPPFLLPKKSPAPSPAARIKSESAGASLTEDHCVSAEFKDPIVIKQEPDLLGTIIPRRKLVTQSCSFYPIPQDCLKSVPNYKNNRIQYFRKECKRLRGFGLTKQKVVFRSVNLPVRCFCLCS
jgi:hypothetical protein